MMGRTVGQPSYILSSSDETGSLRNLGSGSMVRCGILNNKNHLGYRAVPLDSTLLITGTRDGWPNSRIIVLATALLRSS